MSFRGSWRGRLGAAVPWGIVAASALAIASTRPWLASRFHELRITSDVYALPGPEQMIAVSLGHRAAMADLLFAHTLVSYGIHIQEKRHFQFASNYLETIVTLDPKLRDVYYYGDTMLSLQTVRVPNEDVVKARALVERGLQEFPYDAELWTNAGQFMAYLAPSRFDDPKVRDEWKLAGARVLAHACSLYDEKVMPRRCLAAATTLTKQGEREATIQFLERVLMLADDPEVRARAQAWLEQKLGEEHQARIIERRRFFEETWSEDLGFVPRALYSLVPPPFDPFRCAGEGGQGLCGASWRRYGGDQGEPR